MDTRISISRLLDIIANFIWVSHSPFELKYRILRAYRWFLRWSLSHPLEGTKEIEGMEIITSKCKMQISKL